MKYMQLGKDNQCWVRENYNNGVDPEDIVQSLISSNVKKELSEAVYDFVENYSDMAANKSYLPNFSLEKYPQINCLAHIKMPSIYLLDNFLSSEECKELVSLSMPRMERSTVVNQGDGSNELHEARTSFGGFVLRGESAVVENIEKRISDIFSFAVDQGEPIQVLKYSEGAEYKPHYDYFDPKHKASELLLDNGGQRIGTIIMYLNDVDEGGETIFPRLGSTFYPKKGSALFFSSVDEAGKLLGSSLHGGAPVKSGSKWIATKWIRESVFRVGK